MDRNLNLQMSLPGWDGDLVLLCIDGLNLLLQQGAIRSLEPVLDVQQDEENESAAGLLLFESERRAVHCIGKDFEVLHKVPQSRRVCAVLSSARGYLCLLCDSVRMLKREDAKVTSMPVCMARSDSPLHSLAILDHGIGCLTTVDDLMTYMQVLNPGGVSGRHTDAPDLRDERSLG